MVKKSLRTSGVVPGFAKEEQPKQIRRIWSEVETKFVKEAYLRERHKVWIAQKIGCSLKQVSEKIKTLKRKPEKMVADLNYDVDSIDFF